MALAALTLYRRGVRLVPEVYAQLSERGLSE